MKKIIIILSALWLSIGITSAQTQSDVDKAQLTVAKIQEELETKKTLLENAKTVYEKDTTKVDKKVVFEKAMEEVKEAEDILTNANEAFAKAKDQLVQLESMLNGEYEKQIGTLIEKNNAVFEETINLLKIVSLALLVLILALFVFIIIDRSMRRNMILDTVADDENYGTGHRLQKIIDNAVNAMKQHQPTQPLSSYQPRFNESQLISDIKDLQKRIADLEDAGKTTTNTRIVEAKQKNIPPSSCSLFAPSINKDKEFSRTNKEAKDDSVFELLLKNSSDRTVFFTIYGNAQKRVLANSNLVMGCDIQKINSNPMQLDITKGEAQLQENGLWKITKEAIIKFV